MIGRVPQGEELAATRLAPPGAERGGIGHALPEPHTEPGGAEHRTHRARTIKADARVAPGATIRRATVSVTTSPHIRKALVTDCLACGIHTCGATAGALDVVPRECGHVVAAHIHRCR